MKVFVAENSVFSSATNHSLIHVLSNIGFEGVIENVLYCTGVPQNLLLIREMQQVGPTVDFQTERIFIINKDGKVVIKGTVWNNSFIMNFVLVSVSHAYRLMSRLLIRIRIIIIRSFKVSGTRVNPSS